MTVRSSEDPTTRPVEFEDEFEPFLDSAKKDPAFRAAFEDAEEAARTLDTLVRHRVACNLSQSKVAKRMGVRQPTVSQFENEGSDPRLSTLQRYARAIGTRLRLVVDIPSMCDWVSPGPVAYRVPSISVENVTVRRESGFPSKWVHDSRIRQPSRSA